MFLTQLSRQGSGCGAEFEQPARGFTSAVWTTGSGKCLGYPAPQVNEHQNSLMVRESTGCWASPESF